MSIRVELNEQQIVKKVTNDKFGLLAATEWKRLIDPYTPRDTGMLEGNVALRPFEIHYQSPYSIYDYYGTGKTFQKKNPYSTDHWDRAAEGAGQKDKLCRILNSALGSG